MKCQGRSDLETEEFYFYILRYKKVCFTDFYANKCENLDQMEIQIININLIRVKKLI